MTHTPLATLIQHLQFADCYPHATSAFEVFETHISYVILTGDYVYKFKKPVDLGFLDFSTLEKRKFFCEEELRLNRRLAPDIETVYLMPNEKYTYLSSTIIKDVARYGGDISRFVPAPVDRLLKEKFAR